MKKIGLLIIFLVFTGCATTRIIERYPEDAISPWVKGTPPIGCFRGIAINAGNEREGWYFALEDAKKQICNAIGFETREQYERIVMAYNDRVDKKIVADFKCTSAAFLEDIESSIKDTYFEKWIQKTHYGKEHFCNYYVLIYYPQTKIDQMKRKTEKENEKRLHSIERCLSFGKEQESKGEFMKALRTYIYALFIADTLFRNSEIRALECTYKTAELIASLRLVGMGNYVEEHTSAHKVVVKASVNDVPIINVPVRFEIISGKGRLNPLVFTNREGLASSRVRVTSIQRDNRIRAFVDFSDILLIDKRLLPFNEIKQVNFVFSTLSKVANVQGGTLYVVKKKESWLKRIPVLRFDLREVNGLGATFDRYKIEVKGLFESKHWLTRKVKSWSSSEVGEFNLNKKIKIGPKKEVKGILECNAWLTNTFKSMSKEKHCKKIELILILYGKDNKGHPCKVTLQSTSIAENSF